MEKYMIPCPIKEFLGTDCLGCGFQRAFFLVLKGEFAQAFQLYPAVYPLLILGGLVLFSKIHPIPHARKIIFSLSVFSILSIIGSYAFKHFF